MARVFVVAVDGSPGSLRALDLAVDLAKPANDSLILAHIIEWSPFSFHTADELAERHKRREEELERAEKAVLAPASKRVDEAGLSCETVVKHGHPAESLLETADEAKASLIFIGRKGQSRMGALLFGSVAGSLVQMSKIPVTVAP